MPLLTSGPVGNVAPSAINGLLLLAPALEQERVVRAIVKRQRYIAQLDRLDDADIAIQTLVPLPAYSPNSSATEKMPRR